jgi:signal transduction histidine kinase
MPERFVEALNAGDARFREIIERHADAILIVRQDGMTIYANQAAEVMFGRSIAELVGRPFSIAISRAETAEIELPPIAGEHRIAEMRVVETVWQEKPAFLASLRDITDRKQAADALRFLAHASQALAGTLNYPDTIEQVGWLAVAHLADWCLLDLVDGDFVRRSGVVRPRLAQYSAAARLTDAWLLDRQAGGALAEVLDRGEPRVYCDVPEQTLAGLLASPGRVGQLRALGCKSAMVLPLVARGRLIGAITYVSDISAHRFGPAELALAVDLAHRGAMAIDNAALYEESRTAVRHRDQFLAMLAHELRNPLAAIFTAVELMRQSADDARLLTRAEEVIERQGRHMARQLDELLDISRVTHGKIELRKDVVDLRELVHRSLDACQAFISVRQHRVTTNLAEQPLWVLVDAMRLDQVLTNLLSNAAKYMEPGGMIAISAHEESDGLVLRVRDTGSGIAAGDLPHIFDLFVQADRSLDRTQGGLGIGLTLVRHLVEMHGGSVSAASAGEGSGSEFTVRLPAAAAAEPRLVPTVPPVAQRSRRIVLVEDNADARDMLQMLLSVEGHQVDIAEDGRQGLAMIQHVQPEIALVDIGLPLMNGYEIARTLKADSGRRPMLVALTGYGQPEDRQRALEAGFDEHLIKPVDLDMLSKILARIPDPVG